MKLYKRFSVNKVILTILYVSIIFFHFEFAHASFTIEDEKKLGKEFYENLLKNKMLYDNSKVNKYIAEIGLHVLSSIPKSPFQYRFSVIKSSAVNAFATPGGYVYINMGLINLVENESEIASVLAHEIAHVNARHIAERVDKSVKVNIATLAAILAGAFLGGGDMAAAVTGFSVATASTLNLKYSREHEEEADRLGLSYMTKAGYDGNSALDFLKTMRQYEFYSSNIPSYFLTHPGTDDRIRYLDGLLQTRYGNGGAKDRFGKLRRMQTYIMLDLKIPNENLNFFQTELIKKDENADYLYGLAVTQEKLGMVKHSLENFERALRLAPEDGDVLREMGITYFKNAYPTEAVIYLSKAVKIEKNDSQAAIYLGKSYEALGNYTSALEIYKNLEREKTDDVELYYSLASAYGKTNNLGESHYFFGIFFMKKNKSESALFHFREALKHFPGDSARANDIKNLMKPQKKQEGLPVTKSKKRKNPFYQSAGAEVPSLHNRDKSFPR